VTVERQDSEPWWTVYYSDFVAETSSDWMDESELRDWALEFYEGTEELESVASLDLESIREMHRSHFAEFEDRMNGSEALRYAYEDDWLPFEKAGWVRFVEGEHPGSSFNGMEVRREEGLNALRSVIGPLLRLTIHSF